MLGDLGTAYMRGDRYIEAMEVYDGLAKLQPRYPLWQWRLGMSLANQTRFAEAAEKYRIVLKMKDEGVKLEPTHAQEMAELPMRLGNCLRHISGGELDATKRAKLLEDAEKYLAQYAKERPRDARAHKWLGVLHQDQLEKPYAALKHFRASFDLDPMCEDVLRRMVQILSRHPAPEGTSAEAWEAKRVAMKKDLDEGSEKRKAEAKARKKKHGDDGCT